MADVGWHGFMDGSGKVDAGHVRGNVLVVLRGWGCGVVEAAAMTSKYTVVKDDYRRWSILRDGQPIIGENGIARHKYSRKRDALEEIPLIVAAVEYEALCGAQDAAGVFVWTTNEEEQIADYVKALKVNATRWYMSGQMTLQEAGRVQHAKEQEVLDGPRENWLNPDRYFREKRRTMAARIEAYKRAGIEL